MFLVLYFLIFFFFKQKTAYEMRISDWSSDVCSSDLRPRPPDRHVVPGAGHGVGGWAGDRRRRRHRHLVPRFRRPHERRRGDHRHRGGMTTGGRATGGRPTGEDGTRVGVGRRGSVGVGWGGRARSKKKNEEELLTKDH